MTRIKVSSQNSAKRKRKRLLVSSMTILYYGGTAIDFVHSAAVRVSTPSPQQRDVEVEHEKKTNLNLRKTKKKILYEDYPKADDNSAVTTDNIKSVVTADELPPEQPPSWLNQSTYVHLEPQYEQQDKDENEQSPRRKMQNCVRDYEQLKNRILSCNFGDTIRICGNSIVTVYEPNVLAVNCDNIRIFCQGDNGSCIIDKTNQNSRIFDVFGQDFLMQGVTLQNAGNYGTNGGCLLIHGNNAVIQNCYFRNCVARNGGAIYASLETQPVVMIRSSIFQGNLVQLDGSVAYLFQDNRFQNTGNLGNNLVDGNQAQGGCPGMYYFGAPFPNCIILPATGESPRAIGACVSTEDQIQAMVSTVTQGTTIFICATTIEIFAEITLFQPQVSLACVAGDGQCILDGRGGNHRLINILPTAQGVRVSGLVLQNSGASSSYGGCLLNQAYGTTIERTQFRNCVARWGGGLFSFCTIPIVVTACNFVTCRATAMGGAAYYKLPQGERPNIIKSTGSGNSAVQCRDVYDMSPESCSGSCVGLASGLFIPGAVVSDRTCVYTTWTSLQQGINQLNAGLFNTLTLCQQVIFIEEEIIISRDNVRIECLGALSCVLDGLNSRRVMTIEADNVVLEGVSLTNGNARNGGALYVKGDGVQLINCLLGNSFASRQGGGLYLEDNIIVGINDDESARRMSIRRTSFTGNRATQGGGAISMTSASYGSSLMADNTGQNTNFSNGMCYDVLRRDTAFCAPLNKS